MTRRCGTALASAVALTLAACASDLSVAPSAVLTSARKNTVAPSRTTNAVIIGKSTKADVTRALGQTLVISFENGYEVWVYRLANTRTGEFVVLFAPSGIVTKTRVRPEPQSGRAG